MIPGKWIGVRESRRACAATNLDSRTSGLTWMRRKGNRASRRMHRLVFRKELSNELPDLRDDDYYRAGKTFLAFITWTEYGDYAIGSTEEYEYLDFGFSAIDDVFLYVAYIPTKLRGVRNIGYALIAHAKKAGVALPFIPTL
jgi:hypothetical protein